MVTATHEQTNGKSDFIDVLTVIEAYFDGLYYSNVEKLKSICHPDTYLKAPNHRRSLEVWLNDVANRAKPSELELPYQFKILSIEIVHDQAMVKVDCPLFDYLYVDFLGLLKEQGEWKIVNKMYTDTRS